MINNINMKKIQIIIISFLLLISTNIFAQEIELNKSDFSSKDKYKQAKGFVKEGDAIYEQGPGFYRQALEFYLKAYDLYQRNAALDYKIGNCYLASIQKTKCLKFFTEAFKYNPRIMPDIYYKIGRGYHLNLKFDDAIKYYKKYKNSLSPKELQAQRKKIEKRIYECNNGKELVKKPVRVFIDNLGENINSAYPDYSPLISADESMLIFTSRRPGGYNDDRASDGGYFEDIYISYNDGSGWSKAQNIGKPLNTKDHDATIGLSADGQQLFTYKGKQNGGDIFVSELQGEEWSSPTDKPLKKYINTDYHESGASFSFDGRTMYFISDKPDQNLGMHDIFVSNWDDDKERWGESRNLSNTINTEYDERGVFMHPDGRTIYFSSTGHNTMGGYDIFKSELQDDGSWSTPENLGYPINTPGDDRFFVMAASGKHGYYASDKDGGFGSHDIYMITFRGPEKPTIQSNEDNLLANVAPVIETVMEESVEIKTTRLTILKGTVLDAFTNKPVAANIEIVDNEKNEVISVQKSNSATGKYLVSLPSGKNYGIAVKAEGYLFHSENFDIPAATNYQEITKDIMLNKLAVGTKIVLKNIFFDYAKATLRPTSESELNRLLKLLNDFPTLRIEISGHTDNRGSLKTNTRLSEARAKAVVDYLIKHGISADRLEYKGYAYFQPIATNDTEEGRQQNRRVEFKVLSK